MAMKSMEQTPSGYEAQSSSNTPVQETVSSLNQVWHHFLFPQMKCIYMYLLIQFSLRLFQQ